MSTLAIRSIWGALMVGFAALNVWAVATSGLPGIVDYLTTLGPIGIVATVDLLLALLIGITYMTRHARRRAVDGRPWVALTLVTGSIGLLGYLARHDEDRVVSPRGRTADGEAAS